MISSSETGRGSFSVTPQVAIQVCDNGMTFTRDAMREVHLGGRLAEGVIRWSADTHDAALDLVVKQARDAECLPHPRLRGRQGRAGGGRGGHPGARCRGHPRIRRQAAAEQSTILNHFTDGGDRSCGGVLHAVTSTAQTLTDADDAYDMERRGLNAMTLAASFQR
ncbi:MAG: hypothetical protein ACRDTA_10635 [Pseudonocardiaceae bacterium]